MKVTIYGKPNCPLCVRSKELTESKGFTPEYIDIIDAGISREQLSALCGKAVASVPQIFVEGQHIGTYPDLVAHFRASQKAVA